MLTLTLEMLHRMDGEIMKISTWLDGFDGEISRMSSQMMQTKRRLRKVGWVQAALLTHLGIPPIEDSLKHIENGDEEQRGAHQVDLAHDDVED